MSSSNSGAGDGDSLNRDGSAPAPAAAAAPAAALLPALPEFQLKRSVVMTSRAEFSPVACNSVLINLRKEYTISMSQMEALLGVPAAEVESFSQDTNDSGAFPTITTIMLFER
jgi:hypothetical protein